MIVVRSFVLLTDFSDLSNESGGSSSALEVFVHCISIAFMSSESDTKVVAFALFFS